MSLPKFEVKPGGGPDRWWVLCPGCGTSFVNVPDEHPDPRDVSPAWSDHRTVCPILSVDVPWIEDDGGRKEAGYRGDTNDCGVRAASIASGRPYREVYEMMNDAASLEKPRNGRKRSHSRTGVFRKTMDRVMEDLGFAWIPTMTIGTGVTVHLRPDELPTGRIVVRLSRHYCAVIDGVVHDTGNPARGGTRAVYGYWKRT